MSQDYLFRASIEVTFIYTFAATLLELVIGLGIALLLIQGLRGTSLTQTVMLMPWAAAPLVAALMFRLLFFEAGGGCSMISCSVSTLPQRGCLG